ncbi:MULTISPECIES: type I glyceraldehyde-3-phosphate dehydrogenase [Turicibacter]|jgi:glyceraldehyde-3-phosphate dehydrogenase, type I|uniref:Glyceraldehyde-3-phosphate dehydrogenase n=3 Tax=Turicibacter TaxID=191303 RepID=A0A173TDZ3_9FIRM|nr:MULTISPECIES: type I glyceraldehyde-3-phosphate dehydrogenase [Turicibacter]EFF64022.1 glyceraldehyde-3-phosphate dehydrogenase, type I [Turicibacter sanguinis PC909]EGC91463.1 glyceraldehyde-3-phosphate dehydrogenase, type I [Turicibacter sp. HGF1]MCU7190849.1 type I glyceraldehyde-3-phosphate dehydrogenase [Turicibacter sanguinis]MCU7195748.1 type I glyceraldehyde-3-phosphate dehydrogenase [Turicibacter sanguinis]MCU7203085.1 type I glyceraldehyde-3-phosphate dehydrogenase [Turicibacter s
MAVKVAINGFGRIGRLALRLMIENNEFEVVAINDLTDAKTLAHLFKYDSAQGRFNGEIEVKDGAFVVNGKEIKVTAERNPADLPWGELGVDVVLECTGFFTSQEKAGLHLQAGAKKVVISAPATGDIKTVVYNVNQDILDGTETVISGASCTTNCLAPMAKVLNDKYGVQKGFMTTIHAYTNDQNTLDAPHGKGDLRRGRAAAASIVPNSTGAAKAIGLVIPELQGKLDGGAQRVPVITGSLTELVCTLNTKVTAAEINEAMKAAANESFGYTEDEIVSADVIGISYGSLFDATQTKVMEVNGEQLVKVAAWYDNEMSYTNQLIRTLGYFASLIK